MNAYLLEIGVEELPAKQITPVVELFKRNVIEDLKKEKIQYEILNVWSTPRRIVVYIDGLDDKLPDENITIIGPNVSIAYNDGQPTGALLGFLKKNNSTLNEIIIRNNGKNDVIALDKVVIGISSKDVITRLATNWITTASFDKSMHWKDYTIQFARPIRWIVSLYNSEHLPLSIEGLNSNIFTFGHRTLANKRFEIVDAHSYLDVMNDACVIVEPEKRMNIILEQISNLERENSVVVQKDPVLLDEIINIVEYPTVFVAKFDNEFLSLPVPVIVTPMKDHQRYFPTFNSEGKLSTMFLGVRNGDDYFLDTVVKGNEKVLRARLKDAQFFFDDDRKRRLEDFVVGLKTVLYQAKLGTIYDKVLRIKELARYIAELIGLEKKSLSLLDRTVELCKADLNTSIVNEFDELQGVMGKIYAKYDGETDIVANAIESHYHPKFADDEIPKDVFGKIISIADKVDSLVGSYGIGVTPSGGKDPFGLRRMMIGILSIVIADDNFNIDIDLILEKSADLLKANFEQNKDQTVKQVHDSLLQRLRVIMSERQYRHDVIESVIENALTDILVFVAKCDALSCYNNEKLKNIASNLCRAIKLSTDADDTMTVKVDLFEVQAEYTMYEQTTQLTSEINNCVHERKYTEALDKMAELGKAISIFLEDVMIMHENRSIRENRKQLLKICAKAAFEIADFSKLQFS